MHQKLQTQLPHPHPPSKKKIQKKMMINATQILKDIIALNYRNQNDSYIQVFREHPSGIN